ncbi:MAG TPA: DedA family protein [Candidatus Dormibacteraeota bacterium]|nr:DedA family protein [Candidatus Dormibacteraeota bacterium]
MSAWLIQLVSSGGLAAILVTMAGESAGLPISSEIVVPLGGALSASGHLPFWGVVAAATAGNLIGSLVAYWLTRRYGERVVLSRLGHRLGLRRGHLRLSHRIFDRFGLWAVFVGRLLPVVRTYISFPAGASDIRTGWFVVATVAGSIPWNVGLAYAGLKLGQNYPVVSRYLGPAVIPFAIIVVALLAAGWWFGRRLDSEEASQAA